MGDTLTDENLTQLYAPPLKAPLTIRFVPTARYPVKSPLTMIALR
ncbi:hypothetical protein V1281_000605 [Nitrobacteraceae bacterium AZCC 2161]